eukprot:RCo006380
MFPRGQVPRMRNLVRSYYTRTHKEISAVVMPGWMKMGFYGLMASGLAFWTYVSVFARPEFTPTFEQSRVYVNPEWIDEWCRQREIYRLEEKVERSLLKDDPAAAAEDILRLSRSAIYHQLMEDLRVLEPAMDQSTLSQVKNVPAWAKA